MGFGVLSAHEIDDLCDFVLQRLAGRDADPERTAHDLLAHLAASHPDAPALSPVLPLAMSAATLEEMLNGPETQRAAAGAWRMAALLGAEVLAMQSQTPGHPATVAGLWARLGRAT